MKFLGHKQRNSDTFVLFWLSSFILLFIIKNPYLIYAFYALSSILFIFINLYNSKKYYKSIAFLISRFMACFAALWSFLLVPEWCIGWSGRDFGLYHYISNMYINIPFYLYAIYVGLSGIFIHTLSCLILFFASEKTFIIKKNENYYKFLLGIALFILYITTANELTLLVTPTSYGFNGNGNLVVPITMAVFSCYIGASLHEFCCVILGIENDLHIKDARQLGSRGGGQEQTIPVRNITKTRTLVMV